ncbi:MAG: hypothetical protein VX910_00585 [Candidatus Latescibacterota bacterium]|nr:hypothetical protein [Candidatus Latescibacterota bacterium]
MKLDSLKLFATFAVIFSSVTVEAQFRRDSSRANDQEFLRLLKESEELNKEQEARAKRTHNPRLLIRMALDEDASVRFRVGFNPYTPAETLLNLATDPNPTVRWGVARNDRFLFEIDSLFAAGLDRGGNLVELGREFGRHGITLGRTPKVMSDISGRQWSLKDEFHSFEIKRRRLGLFVYSEQIPSDARDLLSKDYSEVVRVGLVSNPNMTPNILNSLMGDVSPIVRKYVGGNENTDANTLEILAKDPERSVKLSVAGNPTTPLHVLDLLAIDHDEAIRLQVCKNAGASQALLLGMIFDNNVDVRTAAAAHGSMPSSGLIKLARDHELSVRQAVVKNANTLPEALKRLSFDDDDGVRGQARTRLASILRDQIKEDRER